MTLLLGVGGVCLGLACYGFAMWLGNGALSSDHWSGRSLMWLWGLRED